MKVPGTMSSILALSFACGSGSRTRVTAPRAFEIKFQALAGDQTVACDQRLTGLGSTHVGARLLDFSLYVHGLRFLRADGSAVEATLDTNQWQAENVALIDFQDKSDSCSGAAKPTNLVIKGSIPNQEEFTGVQFALGLPGSMNHMDATRVSPPFNNPDMFWSWQSGYKAMRLDLAPEGGITRPSDPNFSGTNFFFHLGSTNCSGDPIQGESVTCARVNQPLITLSGFRLQSSVIKLDVAALVSGLNLSSDDTDAPGCMSSEFDVECKSYFDRLGMDLTRGESEPNLSQSVFSIL